MGTFTIIAIIVAVVAALIVLIAYISVLLDDRRYYKMIAERWEEAYFEGYETAGHNDPQGANGHTAYWADLYKVARSAKMAQCDVDKHLY